MNRYEVNTLAVIASKEDFDTIISYLEREGIAKLPEVSGQAKTWNKWTNCDSFMKSYPAPAKLADENTNNVIKYPFNVVLCENKDQLMKVKNLNAYTMLITSVLFNPLNTEEFRGVSINDFVSIIKVEHYGNLISKFSQVMNIMRVGIGISVI